MCSERHMWEQLKEVGCIHLPFFSSMHSFTNSKISLMKRYCAPDSGSGAGGQNCSVAPDSGSGAGGQNCSGAPDSGSGAGLKKLIKWHD